MTSAPTPGREPAAPSRVLVSGGAGFLGSHLCEHLLALGYAVVAVDDLSTGRPENLRSAEREPLFRFLHRDITRDLAEDPALAGPLAAVVHLACPASPRAYLGRPIETLWTGSLGTLNLLELALRKGARFLYASTSEVYGEPEVHPQHEGYWGSVNPVGPRAVYDESKRFGEAAVTVRVHLRDQPPATVAGRSDAAQAGHRRGAQPPRLGAVHPARGRDQMHAARLPAAE